ncbi:MAG: PH domain-containing protein, partial [Wenzhouxiangellaceae bacterium]
LSAAVVVRSEAGSGGLVAAVCFFSAILVIGFVAFKRFSWKFSIDESRISRSYGIISRNQQSVRIKDLRSIALDQSIFQRIFGVGDLAFYSAGSDDAEVRFVGINRPAEWRDRIDDVVDRIKSPDG